MNKLLDTPTAGVSGTVMAAPAGSLGFDTDTQLTASTAQAFKQAGFTFAIRYLSLGSTEKSGDLSTTEANNILNAGLALMAVQHVQYADWCPTAQMGEEYGQNAVNNARSVGLPARLSLWLDLEGISTSASASSVSAYCEAWLNAVSAGGYTPGIYIGYDAILTGHQLSQLPVRYFWNSGSESSSVSGRSYPAEGYCMLQSISSSYVLDGVTYDRDVIETDNLGATPFWLAPQTKPAPIPPKPDGGSGRQSPTGRVILKIAAGCWGALLLYLAGVYTGPLIRSEPAKSQTSIVTTPAPPPEPRPASGPSAAARPPESAIPQSTYLLAGSFDNAANAASRLSTLKNAGYETAIVITSRTTDGHVIHAVHLGPFSNSEAANRTAAQLENELGITSTVMQPKKAN